MKWWDRSWNPMHGCSECGEGCRNCIAMDNLRKQGRSLAPAFNEKALNTSLQTGLNYLVCSLGDIFHPKHSCNNIDRVFEKMAKQYRNRYFIMTKYSGGMLEYFQDNELPYFIRGNDWNHLWMGVSVEDNLALKRIDDLLETPFIKHRFVCLEPLLEEISISRYLEDGRIEWVIIGAESGENARKANPEWFRKIIRECRQHNVPVYVSRIENGGEARTECADFPEEFQIQEVPWKKTEFNDFHKNFVLDGAGFIGTRNNGSGLEFMFKAPAFVYNYWMSKFEGVGDSHEIYPVAFAPQSHAELKNIFRDVHSLVARTVTNMKRREIPQYQIEKILTNDVMVQFYWNPPDTVNPDSIFDDNDNKEINIYLKTVKQILARSKE